MAKGAKPSVTAQAALLAKVPPEAKLVYVKTDTGRCKYKRPDALAESDVIQTKKDGTPVVMLVDPGRPKSVELAPANPVVAELIKRKSEAMEDDPILRAAKEQPEDPVVLQEVVVALGVEAASLGFERAEAERKGEDTSSLSVRRIGALKALADTWLKRKDQITTRGVDLDSPAFKAIMAFTMQTFKEALEDSGARPEMVEVVFNKIAELMGDEWEAEAKNRMKHIV
jgi:hypothetical protein